MDALFLATPFFIFRKDLPVEITGSLQFSAQMLTSAVIMKELSTMLSLTNSVIQYKGMPHDILSLCISFFLSGDLRI